MTNPIRKPFTYTYFSTSLYLIGINFVLFFILNLFENGKLYLSLNPVLFLDRHMYWQAFTYMFVHGNLGHILSNMIGLFFFGMTVERAIGSREFLLIYFLCGVESGLCSLGYFMLTGSYRVFLMGASGAIFAVMFAYAVIFPRAKIFVWGLIPVPSPLLVIIYAFIELISQISRRDGNTAHYAHLFGFAAAFIYFIIRMGINPLTVWKNAYFNQQ